jgi:hypothetical protein
MRFSRRLTTAILLVAATAISGCTSLDTSGSSYMALPETIDITPQSYAPSAAAARASSSAEAAGDIAAMAYAPPPQASTEVVGLIDKYAVVYEVPPELVRRVVKRESNFRPTARNGPYWGLMQIRHDTARGMGYDGPADGLLDAETNLKYAVKYLRGAYLTAEGNQDDAVRYYSRGYYYEAKRKGLLEETGLTTPKRRRLPDALAARLDVNAPPAPVVVSADAVDAEPVAVEPAFAPTVSPTAVTAARTRDLSREAEPGE